MIKLIDTVETLLQVVCVSDLNFTSETIASLTVEAVPVPVKTVTFGC